MSGLLEMKLALAGHVLIISLLLQSQTPHTRTGNRLLAALGGSHFNSNGGSTVTVFCFFLLRKAHASFVGDARGADCDPHTVKLPSELDRFIGPYQQATMYLCTDILVPKATA